MGSTKRVVVEHRRSTAVDPAPYKPKSRATVDLNNDIDLPDLKIGKEQSVTVRGKVTRISDGEYGDGYRSFSMEVKGLNEPEPDADDRGMKGDLAKLKRARTQAPLDGVLDGVFD